MAYHITSACDHSIINKPLPQNKVPEIDFEKYENMIMVQKRIKPKTLYDCKKKYET